MEILIVDNDCNGRALYSSIFEKYGVEAVEVSSVDAA